MIDTAYLNQKIKDSGLKRKYLAEKCGITNQSLCNKIANRKDITAGQVTVLCRELGITDLEEKERIFFADGLNKKET